MNLQKRSPGGGGCGGLDEGREAGEGRVEGEWQGMGASRPTNRLAS